MQNSLALGTKRDRASVQVLGRFQITSYFITLQTGSETGANAVQGAPVVPQSREGASRAPSQGLGRGRFFFQKNKKTRLGYTSVVMTQTQKPARSTGGSNSIPNGENSREMFQNVPAPASMSMRGAPPAPAFLELAGEEESQTGEPAGARLGEHQQVWGRGSF